MFAKVAYQNQIHLIKINQVSSLTQLNNAISKVFTRMPLHFDLKLDSINSHQILDNQEKFMELKNKKQVIIKMFVEEKQQQIENSNGQLLQQKHENQPPQQNIKNNEQIEQNTQITTQKNQQSRQIQKQLQLQPLFTCSLCNTTEKNGVFYRCSVCDDLDLCSNCEEICSHNHPFIKIKDKKYKDMKFFVLLQSQLQKIKVQQEPIQEEEELPQKAQPIFPIQKITEKAVQSFKSLKQKMIASWFNSNKSEQNEINKEEEVKNENISQQIPQLSVKQQQISDEQQNQPKLPFDY